MIYYILNSLVLAMVFWNTGGVVNGTEDRDAGCDYGWKFVKTSGKCVLAGSPSTWPEASQFCRQHQAKIITQQEVDENYRYYPSHFEQGGWTGGLVRYGRLARNNEKSLVVERKYGFDAKNNSNTGCGRYIFDFPFNGIGQVRAIQTSLINCTHLKLPFMCTKKPEYEVFDLSPVSICPQGWLGNESLNTCYKLFQEVFFDYWTAQMSCHSQGGGLMELHTDLQLERAFRVISSAINRQRISWNNMWINGRGDSCSAFFTDYNRTLTWNCRSELSYICSIPAVYNSSTPVLTLATSDSPLSSQTTTYSLFSSRATSDSSPFSSRATSDSSPFSSQANTDSPPFSSQDTPIRDGKTEILLTSGESEEIPPSIKCVVDNIIPQRQSIQWVKDGAYLATVDNVPSLRLDSSLDRILNGEGTGVQPRFTEQDKLGYYWCEVLDLKSNSMKASNKFYVNNPGTRTYAASWRLSKKNLVDQLSATRFNLMRSRSPSVQNILGILTNTTRRTLSAKLNRFRSNGQIIDFQVFHTLYQTVFPRSIRSRSMQSEFLERARSDFQAMYGDGSLSNSGLIKFVSTDYCLETKRNFTYDDGTVKEFVLPDTRLGSVWYTPDICPADQSPIGQVVCDGDKIYGAYWGPFQLNKNCQFTDHNTSSVTDRLADIAKNVSDESIVEDIIQEVEDLTKDGDKLTPKDIIYTTSILDTVVRLNDITQKNAVGIINIINNIQNSKATNLKTANDDSQVSKKILTTLDRLDSKIVTNDNKLRVVTSQTVLEIRDLDPREPLQIGLSVNDETDQPIAFYEDDLNSLFKEHELVYSTTNVGVYLNQDFVRELSRERMSSRIRLALRLFNDSTLFIRNNNTGNISLPNSKIISASLLINDIPYTDLNNTYVTTVFVPYKTLKPEVRSKFSICAFWDIEAEQWSTDGCEYKNTTSGRDVCICDHLTNFAVLLDYYGQDYLVEEVHQLALSIITFIGLTLSIIGLGLTVLSFLLFSKLRKGRPQQTLFNLALAMLCSWIVFLAGINQTDSYGGCITVAVLLHYFILASFMWMLMEGILQYLLFVRVFGTYFENYMWKTAIPAWVLPLVPVIVMLAMDIELYNGGNAYCWMSLTGFYYGFAIPVGVIILANIIIYIMVTYSICNRKNISTSDSKSTTRSTLTNIRASFCCFIILGVSWIFGFLAISDARLVFQYIFTIVNSLQGFLIFALFTLRDKKVRDYWKQLCCCGSKSKGDSGKTKSKTNSDSTPKNSSDLTFTDVRKNSTPSNDINSNNHTRQPDSDRL